MLAVLERIFKECYALFYWLSLGVMNVLTVVSVISVLSVRSFVDVINGEESPPPQNKHKNFLLIIETFVFVVCVMCVATSVKSLSGPDCNA